MSLHQRDYILRMIERIAAVLARVLKRRTEGDLAGARQEIAQAMTDVLGPAGAMVHMVDSRTAADLLSDPDRVTMYARLLDADADLQEGLGQGAAAVRMRQRALEVMLELLIRRTEISDDTRGFIAALATRTGQTAASPRYVPVLEELARSSGA